MLCSAPAGLTSRPDVRGQPVLDDPLRNPYTVQAQARLALQLAAQLGVRQVVLAGHTDGALVALEAAASACRWGHPAFPILAQSALGSVLQSCSHAESCAPGDGHRLAKPALGLCLHGKQHEGWRVCQAQQPDAWAVFVAWRTPVHGQELLCV